MRNNSTSRTKNDLTIEDKMQELAEKCDLDFDGSDDNRLFTKDYGASTLRLSEEKYNEMEKLLDKTSVKGKGFEVGAWNDSSGYKYWTLQQKEDNYIMVTAYIDLKKIDSIDIEELKAAIQKVENVFSRYRI